VTNARLRGEPRRASRAMKIMRDRGKAGNELCLCLRLFSDSMSAALVKASLTTAVQRRSALSNLGHETIHSDTVSGVLPSALENLALAIRYIDQHWRWLSSNYSVHFRNAKPGKQIRLASGRGRSRSDSGRRDILRRLGCPIRC